MLNRVYTVTLYIAFTFKGSNCIKHILINIIHTERFYFLEKEDCRMSNSSPVESVGQVTTEGPQFVTGVGQLVSMGGQVVNIGGQLLTLSSSLSSATFLGSSHSSQGQCS